MGSMDNWPASWYPYTFFGLDRESVDCGLLCNRNIPQNDVVVYVIDRNQFNSQTDEELGVFSFQDDDEVVLYVPSYINARIIAQKGVFTVHRDPTVPLDQTHINGALCQVDQLIIPKAIVRDFVNDLDWFGINRSFIYPGLDGLAYYLDLKAKGGIE